MITAAKSTLPPRVAAFRTILLESDCARAQRIAALLNRGPATEAFTVTSEAQLEGELRAGGVRVVAMSRRTYGLLLHTSLLPELLLLYEEDAELEWRYVLPVIAGRAAPLSLRGAPALERIPATGDDRRIRLLRPREILWARAAGRTTIVAVESAQYRVGTTIGALQRRLGREGFVRVNRSVLVRTDAIRELVPLAHGNYRAVLSDGTAFVTSRRRDVLAAIETGSGSEVPD